MLLVYDSLARAEPAGRIRLANPRHAAVLSVTVRMMRIRHVRMGMVRGLVPVPMAVRPRCLRIMVVQMVPVVVRVGMLMFQRRVRVPVRMPFGQM